ncbi:MAG: PaaI family thioesterase [Spirochaetales bacterium]|nr:PaaI family thioesterase [Spirochaetales bacterium]
MNPDYLLKYFKELALQHSADNLSEVVIPPPVFESMDTEFVSIDPENCTVEVKMPVKSESLNPFGTMQGGIIAGAVDNAIGPLSMIVAPISFTREMELKYRKPVKGSYEYITVKARLEKTVKRMLYFTAEVFNPEGDLLVSAKAMNWIIDP